MGMKLIQINGMVANEDLLDRIGMDPEGEITIIAKVPAPTLGSEEGRDKGQEERPSSTILATVNRSSIHEKLGIRFEDVDGSFFVKSLSPTSPFQETPLAEGMEITHINGMEITGKGMGHVGEILKGLAGTVTVQAVTDSPTDDYPSPASEESRQDTLFEDTFDYVATLGERRDLNGGSNDYFDRGHILRRAS